MKPVSDYLFVFEQREQPFVGYERCLVKDLGFKEAWLRDIIFNEPELVIGPCRAAGLTTDEWYAWRKELKVETGQIDVLLLSSQGKVGIVETKLATNPENRRQVLAQVLDYVGHLANRFAEKMPEIPGGADGQPIADRGDILDALEQGDVLVIIASDEIDSRVTKLSQSLFSRHLTQQWDLALIDIALYRSLGAEDRRVVVPHLRNVVQSDLRQVIRVVVEGETPKAKVEIERITRDVGNASGREKWDEERFFRRLDAGNISPAVRELASQLRDLAHQFPVYVTLSWGTGKSGSMVVKRNGGGLIEIHGSGEIKFRPDKFAKALGDEEAGKYFRALRAVVPDAMEMTYPRLSPDEADKVAPKLFEILQRTLNNLHHG